MVKSEDCEALHETDKALLVYIPEFNEEHWIPKSQIKADSEVYEEGTSGTLVIGEWIAEKIGLL
jgi:hypothetical protein